MMRKKTVFLLVSVAVWGLICSGCGVNDASAVFSLEETEDFAVSDDTSESEELSEDEETMDVEEAGDPEVDEGLDVQDSSAEEEQLGDTSAADSCDITSAELADEMSADAEDTGDSETGETQTTGFTDEEIAVLKENLGIPADQEVIRYETGDPWYWDDVDPGIWLIYVTLYTEKGSAGAAVNMKTLQPERSISPYMEY